MRILFAGGGTGGHLVPGLCIAREVVKSGGEVFFLVSGRKVEEHFFRQSSFPYEVLALQQQAKGLRNLFSLSASLPRSMWQAMRAIQRFRPTRVLGIGGFTSLPAVLASRAMGVRSDLLEVNVVPGRATRALRPLADKVYCAFESTLPKVGSKAIYTGPVLQKIPPALSADQLCAEFGFSPSYPILLVVGGSQGSSALNLAVVQSLAKFIEHNIQVIHIAGAHDYATIQRFYETAKLSAHVVPFMYQMQKAYAVADLVLCRGGASTIAELSAWGLPSVVVPYPGHRDQHQWWNAQQLGEGAYVLEEKVLLQTGMEQQVLPLLLDENRLQNMAQAARRAIRHDGLETICKHLTNPQ